MKWFLCVVAAAVVALGAGAASGAPPVTAAAVDSVAYEGQTYTYTWTNSDASGTYTLGINWGDGTVEAIKPASTLSKTHVYQGDGSYVIKTTAVNVDGTRSGKCNLTVRSLRVYPFASRGKIAIGGNVKARTSLLTLNSTAGFRVATMVAGRWEWIDWPVVAGVPWTIPASIDSLRIRAMSDTVWVHIW